MDVITELFFLTALADLTNYPKSKQITLRGDSMYHRFNVQTAWLAIKESNINQYPTQRHFVMQINNQFTEIWRNRNIKSYMKRSEIQTKFVYKKVPELSKSNSSTQLNRNPRPASPKPITTERSQRPLLTRRLFLGIEFKLFFLFLSNGKTAAVVCCRCLRHSLEQILITQSTEQNL